MPTYNKLVRDLIPKIIEDNGKGLNTRILDDEEYGQELKTKIQEEVQEFLEADTQKNAVEELADVLELMHALAGQMGTSMADIERVRKDKAAKRGGFRRKVYLIDVED